MENFAPMHLGPAEGLTFPRLPYAHPTYNPWADLRGHPLTLVPNKFQERPPGASRMHDKKLRYRRGTARCVVSVEILPIATQQCRNYLHDKT